MRPAEPATQTPAPTPRQDAEPGFDSLVNVDRQEIVCRRQDNGEAHAGAEHDFDWMVVVIPGFSPPGVSLVKWMPVTIAGGMIMPGSGSSQKPKAAIIAGGCLPFAGR